MYGLAYRDDTTGFFSSPYLAPLLPLTNYFYKLMPYFSKIYSMKFKEALSS